jgi:hypothetical protein
MTSVVAPQSTAASTASASPIHCVAPAAGRVKPSKKAQPTLTNATPKPASCVADRRSEGEMNGIPSATTNGDR